MRFTKFGRVVVFTACLGAIVSAHALFAESVHIYLKPEKKTKVKSVTGGWPSHKIATEKLGGDWLAKKHIGNVKYEDIKVAVGMGELDEEYTDWFNEAIAGKRAFRGGGLVLHEQQGVTRAAFSDATPTSITFPAFDSIDETCTDWQFNLSAGVVTGAPYLMKAKEKANRTKCGNNLRMVFSNKGKDTAFDVLSTEEVQAIILEADLDGDGEYEPVGMNIGNVTIRVPASKAGYFKDWMQRSGENPLFEAQSGHLRVRTDKMGTADAWFDGMQPISVTDMGDGSVRVEMLATNWRMRSRPEIL